MPKEVLRQLQVGTAVAVALRLNPFQGQEVILGREGEWCPHRATSLEKNCSVPFISV
jgi:hypothetical protein